MRTHRTRQQSPLRSPHRAPHRGRRLIATAALLPLLALTACSGGGGGGDSLGTASADAPTDAKAGGGAALPEPADGVTGPGAEGAGGDGANRTVVQTRLVIRTGGITVVTKDLAAAQDAIDGLLGRYGGYVESEETTHDGKGRPDSSTLRMRFPARAFDDVMAALDGLGRSVDAHSSSEDVTTEVIDVNARVATGEAVIRRLEGFLAKATTVEEMIRVEQEIATRQAELESLKAQQKYLDDQTALSTVTVHLTRPDTVTPPPAHDEGFLAGLGAGWRALWTVLVAAATALGALLPFAGLLALVGVPLWLLLRRRVSVPSARGRTPSAG